MTEKDYLRELGAYPDIQTPEYMNLCLLALKLAKERGATFDPEPVTLPELEVRCTTQFFVVDGKRGPLTKPEAEEIIRRCKVVDAVQRFI